MSRVIDRQVTQMGEQYDELCIVAALNKLPPADRALVSASWKRYCQRHNELLAANERRTKILNMIQESFQELRLQTKYIVFDLECTRKERDELRAKYE